MPRKRAAMSLPLALRIKGVNQEHPERKDTTRRLQAGGGPEKGKGKGKGKSGPPAAGVEGSNVARDKPCHAHVKGECTAGKACIYSHDSKVINEWAKAHP